MVRGFRTFKEFQESGEGIATNILADRLQKLEAAGIITAEPEETDGRRVNYRLTEKGIDLAPVLLDLLIWGARHEETGVPCALIAEMEKNREAVSRRSRGGGGGNATRLHCSPIYAERTGNKHDRREEERAMSKVRVLVGTRKGAFVLTSDGKRETVGRQRPALRGLGDLPPEGLARRSEPAVCVAVERLVRADDPALQRRRQDVGAGRQQVRLRRRPRHAPVVRRHAAPLGVQARLAPRAVADRSGHRLRRRRRRRPVPLDRRRADLAGTARAARPRLGPALAAGRRRHVPAHDPARSERSRADLHRHLGRGRLPHRRRRQDLAADQPRPALAVHPRPERRGRPLRPPHRDAPVAPERAVHAEALGRDAQRRRRRLVARGQRQPADRLRLLDRRPRARAGDHLRRARSRATRSTFRPTASCASTAAAPAATSGRR